MKQTLLVFFVAAAAAAASAQTPAKPSSTPAPATAKAGAPASKPLTAGSPIVAAFIKAPASIPQYKGIQKPVFTVALRYQEIKIGTGALAEPDKQYKIFYTGYRAADGVKFDSTSDHPRPPVRDKDGKPVLGDDGKPKLGDPQPFPFHQGVGGTIPGFDQGFVGMKVGGKRRIFVPWQLAYGTRNIPDHGPEHPGIPAKSDLIFDVELVDVADAPPPPQMRPPMGGMPGGRPMPGGGMPPHPGTPPTGAAPSTPVTPAKPATTTPPPGTNPGTAAPPTTTSPTAPATPPSSAAPASPAPTPPQPK